MIPRCARYVVLFAAAAALAVMFILVPAIAQAAPFSADVAVDVAVDDATAAPAPAVDTAVYTITLSVEPPDTGFVSGGGSYSDGETVTVVAHPLTGYHFAGWTENGVWLPDASEFSFTATADRTLVAHFAANEYLINVVADPQDAGVVTGDGTYNYGDVITITATPNPGYTFVTWYKRGVPWAPNPSYSFTVTEDATYVAHFALNEYTVAVSADPAAGGTVSGSGVYSYSTAVTVTAAANPGYTFVNWTEDGAEVSTDAGYSFTAAADRALIAHFALDEYTVAVSADPAAGGTVSGSGVYSYSTAVTVTAAANPGYTFVNWTEDGAEVSTDASYSFTAAADRSLIAHFALNEYTVAVSADPAAGGTVSGSGVYSYSTAVTVTATANAGYTFVNWTEDGAEVSTDAGYSFTATADRTLVAHFVEERHWLYFPEVWRD